MSMYLQGHLQGQLQGQLRFYSAIYSAISVHLQCNLSAFTLQLVQFTLQLQGHLQGQLQGHLEGHFFVCLTTQYPPNRPPIRFKIPDSWNFFKYLATILFEMPILFDISSLVISGLFLISSNTKSAVVCVPVCVPEISFVPMSVSVFLSIVNSVCVPVCTPSSVAFSFL